MATTTPSKRLLTISADSVSAFDTMTYGGLNVATEQYVSTQVSNLVASAPGTLDTLNELAAALGDDPNFATTITNSIATKLDASVNPLKNATVSNDTITFTRADGTTFAITTSDANTNYYLNGITKSGNTLTFAVTGAANQTYTFGSNAFTSYTDHSTQGYLTAHPNITAATSVNNSGRTYIQDITVDSNGHVTGITSATETVVNTDTNYYVDGLSFDTATGVLTASVNGTTNQTVDLDGRYQLAGTYNTIIGTDTDINTSGATIIDNIFVTDGVITSMGTRTLSPADIGAATSGHNHDGVYFKYNSENAGFLNLAQNTVGTTYGDTVSTVPSYYFGQKVGDSDGWRLYGEAPASNDVKMIFEIIDDIESGDTWVFRNKKTYSPYNANDVVVIGGDGTITTSGRLYIQTVDTSTSATGLVLGAGGEVEKRTLGSNAFTSTNIPQNVSELTNDAGYITDGNTGWNNSYGFITASSTDTLTNKSGNISQWTNDSGYLTSFDITTQTDSKYLRSNTADTATGLITFSGGINGFTNSAGISGSNFNITGVNQITINDPGEGIIWTGGSSGDITLATIDDANDNILNVSGTNATLAVNGAKVATESYVGTQISNLVASAPATLDTLNELAAALGDDANFSTTMSTALGNRLRVDTASQGLTSTQQSNARTNLGLGTAATSASTDFVAVTGDTMTGTLRLPWKWNSTEISSNTFYVKGNSDQDGFAFGVGTGVSSWFSWDNTAGLKRAIDVWNDGSLIKLGEGGHDVEVKNDLYVPAHIFHTGDTDTYMQFHAADQWRVVTGGTERLEVNNTTTSITNNLAVTGTVTGSNLNVSNWDTAYGWGDHASAGYLTTVAFGDITGTPTTLAGYGITDAVASSSYTAADVLAKIKTVDGAGSGLDADTLDGISSGSFLRSDTNDVLTNNLVIDQVGGNGGIVYEYSGGVYVPKPNGGNYATTTSSFTGAIEIALPTDSWNQSDMISFWVDIYDYAGGVVGESVSMYVYGYAYGAGSWTNCGAVILSDRTDRDYTVRFGHNGSSRHLVYIGETTSTWNYLQISIRDFQAGYSGQNTGRWNNGWAITPNIGSFSNVQTTSSNNYPVTKQLQTARNIALTGDVTGNANFDGSANISISSNIASNVVGAAELNVSGNGSSGQVLTSDGDGTFSWTNKTTNTDTNYYLDGITKSGNTLTFSVSGTTNQTYTFGSNAFTSYTDHSTQGYLTTVAFGDITGTPTTLAGYGITDAFDGAYSSLSGIPSTFTPSAHTHAAGDITSGTFATARIPSLDASKISSGTLNADRLPRPVSGDWWNGGAAVVGADGVMEIGKYIDFHDSDTETSDFSYRMTATNTNMAFSGTITATGYNDANWNTAYGWGDHSTQGYLTSFDITTQTDGKYLRSNANDSFTGTLSWGGSAGLDALDLNNADLEDARGVRAREFTQIGSGEPRNNLGDPTVTEMALFEPQFTCKTDLSNDYNDLTDLTFWVQSTSSSSWVEQTETDDQKRRFLRTNNSGIDIPNGAYKFRVEFHARNYTFANAIYFYWSSQSHSSQVHIWKKRCSDGAWIQHTSSTTTVSSWPGHLWLPFSSIAWLENNTTSTGHYSDIRVEFTPNWSSHATYGTYPIRLSGGQIWGGFPSGRRTPHYYDQNGKLNTWGTLRVSDRLEIDTLDTNTTSTTALVMNGNEVEKRTIPEEAFVSGTRFVDKGQGQVATATDWDTLTSPGMYGVASSSAFTGNNAPPSGVYTYGHVVVTESNGQGIQQTYYPHTGNKIYVRTGWSNGGWYGWQQIWTSTSDGANSGLDADYLDGNHGAHYLDYNNFTNTPTLGTAAASAATDFVAVSGDTMTGNLLLEDSVELRLGTDTDLKIYHDGTTGRIANNTGHLYIQNLSNDKDIYLRSDDGAGGLATYLTIDGFGEKVDISRPLVTSDTVTVGAGTGDSKVIIKKIDNNVSDHIQFFNGTTRVGEIGCEDTSWLRINQETATNIYTPRYIRADSGFFVDGTTKGIDGSGNFIGGTITGASDANVSNWDTAYGWGNHASAGYLTGIAANSVGITELNVSDGTSGQVLTTDGNGTLSFTTVSASGANYYLDGITRTAGTNTLVFSVNGTTNQSYTFGANAFNSTSIPVSGTDFDPVGTDNSTNVTLVTTAANYLSINGQEITLAKVKLSEINGGATAGILATNTSGVLSVDTSTYLTEVAFSDLISTPTTLSGYGITDADNYGSWSIQNSGGTATAITSGKHVRFDGASISGSGTSADPYAVDLSSINTDTQYTAGSGLTLNSNSFSVNGDLSGVTYIIGRDTNDKYVVNTTNHAWYLDGTLDMRLDSSGNLDVDGDVIAFSTVTNSDRRLKTDISTIENASEKVSKLRGVEYTWDYGKHKGKRDIGLIAQEVEEVVPEVVSEGELLDGTTAKRVDYAKLVGLLIEANKELQNRVEQLEKKLDGFTK